MDELPWSGKSETKEKNIVSDTYFHETYAIMSTLVKLDRTICVLLPNKQQLDVKVGVGNVRSALNTCIQWSLWNFPTFHYNFLLLIFFFQPKYTGQDVFNRVVECLGIKELHFFGLTVVKGKSCMQFRNVPQWNIFCLQTWIIKPLIISFYFMNCIFLCVSLCYSSLRNLTM